MTSLKQKGGPFSCNQCDYTANQSYNLSIHIKSIHEGVKYPCDQCDFKASAKCNLARHVKSIHDGVKYPCTSKQHKKVIC